MFLFNRWPRSLWFFNAAANAASSVDVNISVIYNLSASIGAFDREIELSALAFNLSANLQPGGVEDEAGASVGVGIDLDDISYSTLDLKLSVIPIFAIQQTGMTSPDVNAAYNLTASVTATIFPDNVLALSYKASASLSVTLLIADNTDVAVAYNLSATFNTVLDVQSGEVEVDTDVMCALSCSINPTIAIDRGGGLVYSIKKDRYIPVNVGFPLREN